jgi:DNA-binding beta-propeller fold protein YncE
VIGGLPAASFGLIDWLAIPTGTRAKNIGLWHGIGNVIVVVLFIISWLPSAADPPLGAFALSFIGVALALITAWLGRELVDHLGVGIDDNASLNAPSSLAVKHVPVRGGFAFPMRLQRHMFRKALRRLSLPAALLPGIAPTAILALALPALVTAQVHHYEYVFPDGSIYVYDADSGFNLVKTIAVPTSRGTRGAVASAATGMLYISYGPDKGTGGSLLKYDLTKDQVVWTRTYPFGVDSMSISPDGKALYMPTGEANISSGLWKVIDAGSGAVTGEIKSGGAAPHNTVLNLSGSHIYLGPRFSRYLVEADSSTLQTIRRAGPVGGAGGVRPFTINGRETLAFITLTGYLGFQVADLTTGAILFTVPISGFGHKGAGPSCPSHGVSISPDEKELYVVDAPNSYVHVYDITGLPGSPPVQVADVALRGRLSGKKTPCAYDCFRQGWLHHSRDGHYVFVGDSGDVIDTGLRRTVATLPAMNNSPVEIEIDFQNGAVVWAMSNRSSIGAVTASKRAGYSTRADRRTAYPQSHRLRAHANGLDQE